MDSISFHKSTLTDLVLGMMPRSKSRGKKASAQKLEREGGRLDSREPPSEYDYGNPSYPDFRGYEFGDAMYSSFARIQGPSIRARPSIHDDAYQEFGGHGIPAAFGQLPYGYEYPRGRGSLAYGEGGYGGGSVGYDERRFSAPVPNYYDPHPGPQPRYREATSLPDVRRDASVEEQIDELLGAVERSSLADSDVSELLLNGASEELEGQLADMKAERRRVGEVGDVVVECVALEDLPAVIQTIAIAREDARLRFEEEVGYGTEQIEEVAPMLVDLFQLAQLLAQEVL